MKQFYFSIKEKLTSLFGKIEQKEKSPPIDIESNAPAIVENLSYSIKYIQNVLGVEANGEIEEGTINAIASYLGCDATIFNIQRTVGVKVDGIIGRKTINALRAAIQPKVWSVRDGLSLAAYNLIIKYEVGGGESYYNKYLKNPTWPGGASGVTIGIGYDLGYNTKAQFTRDWRDVLDNITFGRLQRVVGKKTDAAKIVLKGIKDISISWESAEKVFRESTIPRFVEMTKKAFPGAEELAPDVFGALVSIVFNRGASMTGDRRKEMRAIKNAIAKNPENKEELYEYIADQIESMKRLWKGKGLDGLLTRRDAEADLVRNSV